MSVVDSGSSQNPQTVECSTEPSVKEENKNSADGSSPMDDSSISEAISQLPEEYPDELKSPEEPKRAKIKFSSEAEYSGDNLDRSLGSGSLGNEQSIKNGLATMGTTLDTEWNPNRKTSFSQDPDDGVKNDTIQRWGEEYDRWEYYTQLDSGVRDNGWEKIDREHGQESDIGLFCDRLGLTDYQQDRVEYLFDGVDADSYRGGFEHEDVILALMSLVQNEDVSIDGTDIRDTERWDQLLNELDKDQKDIRKLRNKLRPL